MINEKLKKRDMAMGFFLHPLEYLFERDKRIKGIKNYNDISQSVKSNYISDRLDIESNHTF